MSSRYRLIHASPAAPVPGSIVSFDLLSPPGTDLWRLPPPVSTNANNAPSFIRSAKTASFISAQATVSANWTRLYDQGGLVFYFSNGAWIKTGIEYYGGRANLGTVATHTSATSDWSLVPLENGATSVTVLVERGKKVVGTAATSLWIYLVSPSGEKLAVREVTWVSPLQPKLPASAAVHLPHPFQALADVGDSFEIGAYVARPTKNGDDDTEELTVHFTDLEVNAGED